MQEIRCDYLKKERKKEKKKKKKKKKKGCGGLFVDNIVLLLI